MGEEHPLQGEGLTLLADLAEGHLDLDRLLTIAGARGPTVATEPEPQPVVRPPVRLAVARDAAFCFYYEDNLDLLRAAGAELVFFSPLTDTAIPEGAAGLYLGGGYPELHARELSDNQPLRAAIRAFADAGRPVLAECGGFMALTRSIIDLDGRDHPMVGVFPFASRMQPRLRSLGYRRATQTRPTILGPKGTVLHGHEFHYSVIEGADPTAATAFQLEDNRAEGYIYRNTLAGYVHLHWGRTPEVAAALVQACRQFS
jgi:cobyrinic acid a,c-diamide synthase